MFENEDKLLQHEWSTDSREDAPDCNVDDNRENEDYTQKEDKDPDSYKHNSSTGFHPSNAFHKLPAVHRILRPFLRSFSEQEGNQNHTHIYSHSLHKAVKNKYFFQKDGKHTSTKFRWHKKLKNHFENSSFKQREEFTYLLTKKKTSVVEVQADLCQQYLDEASLLYQANQYDNAIDFAEKALKTVKRDSAQLADIYQMCASIRDEKMTQIQYMYPSQIPLILILIQTYEKCIKNRRQLKGLYNKVQLANALNRSAFYYSGVSMRGGSEEISVEYGHFQAMKYINESISIFKELDDKVNVANCLITKGVIYGIACADQLNAYKEAEQILLQVTQGIHPFVDRLYHNMGIHYEESFQQQLAYDCNSRWYAVCINLYGSEHYKTLRPISILNEPQYKRMALEKGFQVPKLQHHS